MEEVFVANGGEPYLRPYLEAAARFGGGFGALLWASPKTQRKRFEALARVVDFHGRTILDAGCGRGDLLEYLLKMEIRPAEYIGLEAVEALAAAAEAKELPGARILRGDFVVEPLKMFVGCDVVTFSGSLNTLDHPAFFATLRHGFEAAGEELAFNFLSSPALAGKAYLFWRPVEAVREFGHTLTARVDLIEDYLNGDCTMKFAKA